MVDYCSPVCLLAVATSRPVAMFIRVGSSSQQLLEIFDTWVRLSCAGVRRNVQFAAVGNKTEASQKMEEAMSQQNTESLEGCLPTLELAS